MVLALSAAVNLQIHPVRGAMLRRHQQLDFAGSLHFVTLVTHERGAWFTSGESCRAILESFEFCCSKTGVDCLGYVLMPDHLHALLWQQRATENIPKLVQDFKKFTSRKLRPANYTGETLWRIRYDDVPVPGPEAAKTKIVYMHGNPVRNGLVERAEDYPWSSAADYAELRSGVVTVSKAW
jgi:putative transposase